MKHLDTTITQFLTIFNLILLCTFSPIGQTASISDLFITEIMANPSAVSDTQGEWFELFNPTTESIDLSGLILSDDGSNSHTISTVSNLLVSPGSYFVMARNSDSSLNGGVTANYVYSNFSLGNSNDQIIFSDSTGEQLRFNYNSGFVPSGASMELIDAVMLPSNYTATTTVFGSGDFGTPGTKGLFTPPATISPVPIPGSIWLISSGLIGLLSFNHKLKTC